MSAGRSLEQRPTRDEAGREPIEDDPDARHSPQVGMGDQPERDRQLRQRITEAPEQRIGITDKAGQSSNAETLISGASQREQGAGAVDDAV